MILLFFLCFTLTFPIITSFQIKRPHVDTLQIPPPPKNQPLRFIALGDWGASLHSIDQRNEQKRVADAIAKLAENTRISFIVSTGDNFYSNGLRSLNDPQFKLSFTDVFSQPSLAKIPFLVSLGNHDHHNPVRYELEQKSDPRWHLISRYYSLRIPLNDNKFLTLAIMDSTPGVYQYKTPKNPYLRNNVLHAHFDKQIEWLKNTLTTKDEFKIVVLHHPLVNTERSKRYTRFRNLLLPILLENNVAAIINGHDHKLQFDKIRYLLPNGNRQRLDQIVSGAGAKAGLFEQPEIFENEHAQLNEQLQNSGLLDHVKFEPIDNTSTEFRFEAASDTTKLGSNEENFDNSGAETNNVIHQQRYISSSYRPLSGTVLPFSSRHKLDQVLRFDQPIRERLYFRPRRQISLRLKKAKPSSSVFRRKQKVGSKHIATINTSHSKQKYQQFPLPAGKWLIQNSFDFDFSTVNVEQKGGFALISIFADEGRIQTKFYDAKGNVLSTLNSFLTDHHRNIWKIMHPNRKRRKLNQLNQNQTLIISDGVTEREEPLHESLRSQEIDYSNLLNDQQHQPPNSLESAAPISQHPSNSINEQMTTGISLLPDSHVNVISQQFHSKTSEQQLQLNLIDQHFATRYQKIYGQNRSPYADSSSGVSGLQARF